MDITKQNLQSYLSKCRIVLACLQGQRLVTSSNLKETYSAFVHFLGDHESIFKDLQKKKVWFKKDIFYQIIRKSSNLDFSNLDTFDLSNMIKKVLFALKGDEYGLESVVTTAKKDVEYLENRIKSLETFKSYEVLNIKSKDTLNIFLAFLRGEHVLSIAEARAFASFVSSNAELDIEEDIARTKRVDKERSSKYDLDAFLDSIRFGRYLSDEETQAFCRFISEEHTEGIELKIIWELNKL